MSISVQQATMNELESLYEIERECFTAEAFGKKQIASLLLDPASVGILAMVNGEVAGFTIGLVHVAEDEEKTGHIYTLDVAIRYRRKGIGSRLLEEIERIFTENGVNSCYLEMRVDNVAAQMLYRKHGYLEVETLDNYYQRGVHAIRLKKML